MADAALAIARRLLAGPGGASAAADSLRAAADADDAVASDARLWAALAYLCTEAGDASGTAHARRCIARIRAPEEPSPVQSLAPVLEDEGATPRRRTRRNEKNTEQDVADRVARRVAESAARMAGLREAARELFANVSPQLQAPLRGERRTDGVARLVRHMGVLRARGRNIFTAAREDVEAGEKRSQRFAEAAMLSSDDEEDNEEEEVREDEESEDDDDREDEGSEDDDSSETGCDSSSGGSDHPFRPINREQSELGEEFDGHETDVHYPRRDNDETNYFTSDDSSVCFRRMRGALDLSSSSSSSFADDDTDSHCCCESSVSSRISHGRSGTQAACDDFFGAPFTFTEPICCTVYRLNASDSDDDSMDFSAVDTPLRAVGARSFWSSPASGTSSAAGSSENPRSAATAAWISRAQAGSSRELYSGSPITPHVASDTDRLATGSASSRRPLEFTVPRGRSFFYDEPNGNHGPQQLNSISLENITSTMPVNAPSGRGRTRLSQLGAARLTPARTAGQASAGATVAVGSGSSSGVPHSRRWSRSRLHRITAPNPESSSSSDSDSSVDVVLRTHRRVQNGTLESVTPGNTGGGLDAMLTELELSRQRTQRHIRMLERETAITREMTRMLTEEHQVDGSERNEDGVSELDLTRAREFLEEQRRYRAGSRGIELVDNADEGDESSDYEVDDEFEGDDVVLHRYYLSNALRALRGGGHGEHEDGVAWEAVNGDYLASEDDFEDDDYDDYSEPGDAMNNLFREFEEDGRILGSDHEDLYSREHSGSNHLSIDDSDNDSTTADRGMPTRAEMQTSYRAPVGYRAPVANFRRRNLVLRGTLNGLDADAEDNGDESTLLPNAQRSRGQRLQYVVDDVDEHQSDFIDAEGVELAGGYVSEDGEDNDDSDGPDWLAEHEQWLDPSHPGNGLAAAFWHDDEDEVFFYGEKRTTAEMEAIAPGHVAPAEVRTTICVICTEELGSRRVRKLPCGHYFHLSDCVDEWCRRNATCPTCRAVLECPTDGAPRRSSVDREGLTILEISRRMRMRQGRGTGNYGGYASA